MIETRGENDLVEVGDGANGTRMLLLSREAMSCQVRAINRELKKTHNGTCMSSSAVRFVINRSSRDGRIWLTAQHDRWHTEHLTWWHDNWNEFLQKRNRWKQERQRSGCYSLVSTVEFRTRRNSTARHFPMLQCATRFWLGCNKAKSRRMGLNTVVNAKLR